MVAGCSSGCSTSGCWISRSVGIRSAKREESGIGPSSLVMCRSSARGLRSVCGMASEIIRERVAGIVIGTAGAAVALWCIFTFAFIGIGTPAPFDPPRRLVIEGPYRFVRNPMYIGAGLALAGAALFYWSLALLGYTGLFFLAT